jgi:flavorubredoxin
MPAMQINDGVFSVGAIDWDRPLFDALIPLPRGTSYNSYLVQGNEKTALIDTVDPCKFHELRNNLSALKIERLDYIVANHAEQDHSGALPDLLKLYPDAKIVTNAKARQFLQQLLHLGNDCFLEVAHRGTLPLGGRTFEFFLAPWVHWPETMFTYLKEDQILFSCDFMGSHLATSDTFATDHTLVLQEAKRYYAQIMMPYAMSVRQHLEMVEALPLKLIAPSHGPVYDRPALILDAYRDWSSPAVKNEVLLLYISMHGSTAKMAEHLVERLRARAIPVRPFNLVGADLGEVALAAVDAATICFASPAVLSGLHPAMVQAVYLINALKPKARFVAFMGSYTWGARFSQRLQEQLENLSAEFIEGVVCRGLPRSEDLEAVARLADAIAEKHRAL